MEVRSRGQGWRRPHILSTLDFFTDWVISRGMKFLTAAIFGLSCVTAALGQVKSEVIDYKQGDTALEGYLAFDPAVKGKRPGVLIVHQWKGLGDYEKKRADMLAKLGYTAFAVEIYGKGIRPQENQEAGALAGKYKKDRDLLRARVRAGLEMLQKNELTDPKHIAAIGYCFG